MLSIYSGDSLQKWEIIGISGLICLFIGAIFVAWGIQAVEQIHIEQIGGQIIASLNPTFVVLFMIGYFSVGLGIGAIACTYTIYKLEKQHLPQSPSSS